MSLLDILLGFGLPVDLHTSVEKPSPSPPATWLLVLLCFFLESWQPQIIWGVGSLAILVAWRLMEIVLPSLCTSVQYLGSPKANSFGQCCCDWWCSRWEEAWSYRYHYLIGCADVVQHVQIDQPWEEKVSTGRYRKCLSRYISGHLQPKPGLHGTLWPKDRKYYDISMSIQADCRGL